MSAIFQSCFKSAPTKVAIVSLSILFAHTGLSSLNLTSHSNVCVCVCVWDQFGTHSDLMTWCPPKLKSVREIDFQSFPLCFRHPDPIRVRPFSFRFGFFVFFAFDHLHSCSAIVSPIRSDSKWQQRLKHLFMFDFDLCVLTHIPARISRLSVRRSPSTHQIASTTASLRHRVCPNSHSGRCRHLTRFSLHLLFQLPSVFIFLSCTVDQLKTKQKSRWRWRRRKKRDERAGSSRPHGLAHALAPRTHTHTHTSGSN